MSAAWVSSQVGTVIDVQGVSGGASVDRIEIPQGKWSVNRAEATFVVWVKVKTFANYDNIFAGGTRFNARPYLYQTPDSEWAVGLGSTAGTGGLNTVSIVSSAQDYLITIDNKFHQIVVTADMANSDSRLYVDGLLDEVDTYCNGLIDFGSSSLFVGGPDSTNNGSDFEFSQLLIYDRVLTHSEIQQLYIDSSALFRRKAQYFLSSESVSGDPTITPSAQTLILTQPAPTISIVQNVTVTPSVQSLTLTQPTPSISIIENATVTPSAQSLTLTLPAPTIDITGNVTVTPAAQSLTLVQPAPTVDITGSATVTPSEQTLTLTQPAPTVTIVQSVTVTPAVQSLTLTQQTPSINMGGILENSFELTLFIDQEKSFDLAIDQDIEFIMEF